LGIIRLVARSGVCLDSGAGRAYCRLWLETSSSGTDNPQAPRSRIPHSQGGGPSSTGGEEWREEDCRRLEAGGWRLEPVSELLGRWVAGSRAQRSEVCSTVAKCPLPTAHSSLPTKLRVSSPPDCVKLAKLSDRGGELRKLAQALCSSTFVRPSSAPPPDGLALAIPVDVACRNSTTHTAPGLSQSESIPQMCATTGADGV
jgi:hypothetical protein